MKYAAEFIFGTVLGVPYTLSDDAQSFRNHMGPRIHYTHDNQPVRSLHIEPFSEIFSTTIPDNDPDWLFDHLHFDGNQVSDNDIFYYVFFHLSCIEEYRNFPPDSHGRFTASCSRARHLFRRPFVDMAIRSLATALSEQFPEWPTPVPVYSFQPTLDLDNTFAYLAKGFVRNAFAALRDGTRLKIAALMERAAVLTGRKPDPYQTFDWQKTEHARHDVQPIYFFLLGQYGPFDKMPDHRQPRQHNLLQTLAGQYPCGLHPSYGSNSDPQQLHDEVAAFRQITGYAPTRSRQHYLKLRFPETCRRLIAAGIHHDYSLLYADSIGFRSGTAYPHRWFDVHQNHITELTLHPACIMDVTLKNYMQLSPDQACRLITEIVTDIRTFGGTFISVWHNDTLTDRHEWQGWRRVYQHLLETAAAQSTTN